MKVAYEKKTKMVLFLYVDAKNRVRISITKKKLFIQEVYPSFVSVKILTRFGVVEV